MKTIVLLMMLFASMAIADPYYGPRNRLKYPMTQDPDEFPREVEIFIGELHKQEFVDETGLMKKRLEEDPRDWESALLPIIGNPEKYGPYLPRTALETGLKRNGFARNSELPEAVVKLFRYQRDRALKKQRDDRSAGTDRGGGRVILSNFMAGALRINLPEILQEVLIYYNSEAETEMNMIVTYPPNNVADALRTYGDERHIGEAKKFAQKLRDVGKDDIADDIARSIERIEKDAKRAQSTPSREAPAAAKENTRGKDDAPATWEEKSLPLPWIAAAIALAVSLVFFLKRKLTP